MEVDIWSEAAITAFDELSSEALSIDFIPTDVQPFVDRIFGCLKITTKRGQTDMVQTLIQLGLAKKVDSTRFFKGMICVEERSRYAIGALWRYTEILYQSSE